MMIIRMTSIRALHAHRMTYSLLDTVKKMNMRNVRNEGEK